MSLEIDVHSAQTAILRELLFHPSAGFAELQKPTGLDSDHFKFHIARLVELGYVEKTDTGKYRLTTPGKEYSNRLDTDKNTIEKQPKLSVVLVIEREDGKVLQQERLKQPYYGFWGFPTGKVGWGEKLLDAAARELMEETGLQAELRVSGLFHKMDYDNTTKKLLEDKYFAIIHGVNPSGNFISDMEGHHNEWLAHEEVNSKDKVFESIIETAEMAKGKNYDYIEKAYFYDKKDY